MSRTSSVHPKPSRNLIPQPANSSQLADHKLSFENKPLFFNEQELGIPSPGFLATPTSSASQGDRSSICPFGTDASSKLSESRQSHRLEDRSIHHAPPSSSHIPLTKASTSRESILFDNDFSRKDLLGPHASEDRMPEHIHAALCHGPQQRKYKYIHSDGSCQLLVTAMNETPHLIPVLSRLCAYHPNAARVWLCDSGVRYVSKQLPDEGGLCGYRNLQMLITYIQHVMPPDDHPFSGCVPTVIDIQEVVHKGWENGVNSHGLAETGGIRGTRKYIGTSEVETFLVMTGIKCPTKYITRSSTKTAHEELLNFVQNHFEARDKNIRGGAVVLTHRPPVYLQHQGHSMTIVGLMLNDDNTRDLLVFDPSFQPLPELLDIQRSRFSEPPPNLSQLLRMYLRGARYLANYDEFELLTVLVDRGNLKSLQRPDLWQQRTRVL